MQSDKGIPVTPMPPDMERVFFPRGVITQMAQGLEHQGGLVCGILANDGRTITVVVYPELCAVCHQIVPPFPHDNHTITSKSLVYRLMEEELPDAV